MKIILLYMRVLRKWDASFFEPKSYSESAIRFLKTYQQFKPNIEHELVVVNCGARKKDDLFDSVATRYAYYNEGGYDCGAYQAIGKTMDCDLVVCLNTIAYFWRTKWLEPFAKACQEYGPGVYGPSASYENNPHLRTPCIAFAPEVIEKYPYIIDSRDMACNFEHGKDNFSLWAHRKGFPSLLVTENGIFKMGEWRKPDNIFRRGDQSNCLVWDRHTDIYQAADTKVKAVLSKAADGIR